jgi:hypothetical protein
MGKNAEICSSSALEHSGALLAPPLLEATEVSAAIVSIEINL